MNASRRRLAASFNNSIPGSAVQSLLDGESITSIQDVSGSIPGNPSDVLNEIPMDQDESQGLMHPEDFKTSNRGQFSSAPPGISHQQTRTEQVNDIIARYDQALQEAREQNQNNVVMVNELSNSNEQLRNDISALKDQVQKLIANIEKERAEHEKALQNMCHNAEERAKTMKVDYAKALKEENLKLRSNLIQSHEHESERLVKHYEEESHHREKQFQKLMKVKEASYQANLEEMAKQINAIKADRITNVPPCPPQPSARKSLGAMRKEVFETLPGTVNTNRGSAVQSTGLSVNWDENTLPSSNRQVHFGCTSTPRHTLPINLHDESEEIISGSSLNSSKPMPAPRKNKSMDHTCPEKVAAATFNSTVHVMASEFKKLKEPKLAKLKGGYSSEANLFFQGWAKDVRAVVADCQLTDSEAIQLIKEYTEASAQKQVDSFLDLTEYPTFETLMKELASVYSPPDDDASLMAEFYGHKQLAKESDDAFAEELQLLAQKIINAKPSFRSEANTAMKQQFSNGLKDPYHQISARNIIQSKPQLTFTEFRTEMSVILRSRVKRPKTVNTNAVDNIYVQDEEPPKPAKQRKQEGDSQSQAELIAKVAAVQANNQRLQEKLEKLESTRLSQVLTQTVTNSGPSNVKPNPSHTQNKSKYMGKPRESKLTPGTDGSLNPNIKCNYCGDTGHITKVCP